MQRHVDKNKHGKSKLLVAANVRRRHDRARNRFSRNKTKKKIKQGVQRSQTRAAQPVKKQIGRRQIPCYKCGKTRGRCRYFKGGLGENIAKRLNRKLLQALPQRILQADARTWEDIQDVTLYQQQMDSKERISYAVLWPSTYCWLIFCDGYVWKALQGATGVSFTDVPLWSKWRTVLETYQAENESWLAGVFYSGVKL